MTSCSINLSCYTVHKKRIFKSLVRDEEERNLDSQRRVIDHNQTPQKSVISLPVKELSPLLVSPKSKYSRNVFKREINSPVKTHEGYLGSPIRIHRSPITQHSRLKSGRYSSMKYNNGQKSRHIIKDDETMMQLVYLEEQYQRSRKAILDLREMARNFKKKLESVEVTMSDHAPVSPLSSDEIDAYNSILRRRGLAGSCGNIDLTNDDVQLFKGTRWLNDECVNCYMEHLLARCKKNKDLPRCHFFNSFFYMFLYTKNGYNYAKVKNWTKKIDIFSFNKIIIPIHLGNHWTLGVVNFDKKRFEYYDSFQASSTPFFEVMRRYLKEEFIDKKKTGELDLSDWTDSIPTEIPHQTNGWDCGIFACKYADYCSRGVPFDFRQIDMPILRQRIVLEMFNTM